MGLLYSNLNLNTLPECKFAYQMVNSALLIPCIEYQRMLRMEKVSQIAENFSEYVANEPKVSFRDGRFYIFDGQNTVEVRRTCNGGMELPIRCKVFYGLTKEDEATLFAIQTGNATCLTAGERLRANLVAENPDALYFVGITSNAGVEFAYDGIRAPWKIYCIETAYELYKQHGCERYVEMLHIYADMEPHIGSEQGGKRPVVVLQNNIGNRHSPTLIVATVTTRTEKKKNQPTHVLVDSNPAFEEPSMILLEQIFTIDKSRIERFMGYVSKAEMLRIDMALLVSLALNVLSGNHSE